MESGFLAEATATLASSLEPGVILDRLVHLAVAAHSDFCTVDLVDAAGRITRSHGAHAEHDQAEAVQTYVQVGAELPPSHPVRRTIQSGSSLLFPVVASPPLLRQPNDPKHRDALEQLGPQSMIVVPLSARGRVLGALALFSARPDLRFGTGDLAVAEELGRRAALALDNARLYIEAQAAEARSQEHVGRIKALAEASRMFVEAGLDVPAIAQAVVRSVSSLGELCFLRVFEESSHGLRSAAILSGDDARAAELSEHFFREVISEHESEVYGEALATGRAVRLMGMAAHRLPEADRALLEPLSPTSLLIVPLALVDHPLGVLVIARDDVHAPFDSDDQIFAEDVAHRAALALQNANLYAHARDATRLRDEFLATLSHELRTPLTAILGWTQMLKSGRHASGALPRALEVIERNARVQTRLVEDLLDVSRIINGKLQLELKESDLHLPVDAAVEALRPAAMTKQIQLEATLEPDVGRAMTDPNRFQQVVWNLISNAVKFTPAGGRVEVGLRRDGEFAELSVKDTGEGIAPEFAPHVFERFRQADGSTTRRHSGLGLGLSIVRHLVELNGGQVRAESEGLGKGSRFVVRIPCCDAPPETDGSKSLAAAALAAAQAELESEPDLEGVRILLVDDEADSLDIVARLLRQRGARVTARNCVNGALTALRQTRQRFDVLVSDIGMPGEDGYTLMKALRSLNHENVRELPAVALTAYARAEDRDRALAAGFQQHLTKPVDPRELAELVGKLARSEDPQQH